MKVMLLIGGPVVYVEIVMLCRTKIYSQIMVCASMWLKLLVISAIVQTIVWLCIAVSLVACCQQGRCFRMSGLVICSSLCFINTGSVMLTICALMWSFLLRLWLLASVVQVSSLLTRGTMFERLLRMLCVACRRPKLLYFGIDRVLPYVWIWLGIAVNWALDWYYRLFSGYKYNIRTTFLKWMR